jgi:hypothetical protein
VKAKKSIEVAHRFIELLPDTLEERTLYVSMEYKSIVHLCLCGCATKVVTPLSPTGWSMTFDGKTVSLYPSIGNWNLACRSHYWIEKSRVWWSDQWTQAQIDAGFERDVWLKEDYYARERGGAPGAQGARSPEGAGHVAAKQKWWPRLKGRIGRKKG